MNSTIRNFRYKESLIKEYNNWVLLLRPKQVTLSSLIIACKEDAESFSTISIEASSELFIIIKEVESILSSLFSFDKINYLGLMMVDKHVHFHVFPRYSSPCIFRGVAYQDINWPKAPNLSDELLLNKEEFAKLRMFLCRSFISNE